MNNTSVQEISTNGSTSQLISATELAELLKLSRRTLSRLQSRNALPKPIRLGRSVRWQLDAIRQWIADGCPNLNDSQ